MRLFSQWKNRCDLFVSNGMASILLKIMCEKFELQNFCTCQIHDESPSSPEAQFAYISATESSDRQSNKV
jgi:hypothetical protein